MTKEQASQIPELDIHVTPLIEDLFYCILAEVGEISEEAGKAAHKRVVDLCKKSGNTAPPLKRSFEQAARMHENVQKYGVACVEWCG